MGTHDDLQFDANRAAITRSKHLLERFLEGKNNALLSPAEKALIESAIEQLEDVEKSLGQGKKISGPVAAAIAAALAVAGEVVRQVIRVWMGGGGGS